jgi:hypothetical protein
MSESELRKTVRQKPVSEKAARSHQGNGIQLFLRYQAPAERLDRRAVAEFERRQKAPAGAAERTHFGRRTNPSNPKKIQLILRPGRLRQTN